MAVFGDEEFTGFFEIFADGFIFVAGIDREDKEKVSFRLVAEEEEVRIQEDVLSRTIKLS